MKITKATLKKIIKEEIAETLSEGPGPDFPGQYVPAPGDEGGGSKETDYEAVELVRGVVEAWVAAHKQLSNPESQKLFEHYLKSNLELYLQKWEEDRGDEPLSADLADLPEELP